MFGGAENVGSIEYDARIDTKKLSNDARNVESIVGSTGKKIGHGLATAGKAAAIGVGIASVAAVGFGVVSVKAFMDSENALTQMVAVLKSTNHAAGLGEDQLMEYAQALQSVTRYSDESIMSAQNMLLTFTNIGKKTFPGATEAVLDMATAMGTDLKSTAIQVGKALQDPVRGATALQRVGVRLTESQKKLIAKHVEAGDAAAAQAVILKELQTEFGGSAKAAGETFAGRLDILKNKFNDIQETIGRVIVTAITPLVSKIADFLASVDWEALIKRSIEAIKGLITTLSNTYKLVATYLGPGISRFIFIIKELWHWLSGMLGPSVKALVETLQDRLLPQLLKIWNTIEPGFTTALKVLGVVIGVIIVAALWLFINILNVAISVLGFVVRAVTNVIKWFGNFVGIVVNTVKTVGTWFGHLPGYIATAFKAVVNWFKKLPRMILDAIGDLGNVLLDAGKSIVNGFIQGIKDKFNDVKETLGNLTSKLTSWKGPLSVDKVLLQKNGQAVIGGFIKGLESQYGAVQSSLGGLTGGLSSEISAGSAGIHSMNSIEANATSGSVVNNIGTINIASEVDGDRLIRRLTQEQEIIGKGLVPQTRYA